MMMMSESDFNFPAGSNNPNSNPNPNPGTKKVSGGSKFKGVLPQPNGNWGAQIYVKQQRIWLGTFRSEIEAAMAYDSAAVLFRNAESPRNLPCTTFDPSQEQRFQSLHFQKDVLSMIKDGSYHSRFNEYLRARAVGPTAEKNNNLGVGGYSVKQLFQKELTLSDVGKLNRLVIPKKYAEKHLPKITEHNNNYNNNVEYSIVNGGMDLVFYDESMRSWCFKYCYWSSSQSYVFTKGWNQFVKEKGLRLNDVVTFYQCENVGENRFFSMIGISRDGEQIPNRVNVGAVGLLDSRAADIDQVAGGESNVPAKPVVPPFRLFGVNIDCSRV